MIPLCHSLTSSFVPPPNYQTRRFSDPSSSQPYQNQVYTDNYYKQQPAPIDRDASIKGLQPPPPSLQMGPPAQVMSFNNNFNGMVPDSMNGPTGDDDDSTAMMPVTTTESIIMKDMHPDKVKFNLPAVLLVFVLFLAVVVVLFLRITFLHALLVAGNGSSVQINGRFGLWGNNNNGAGKPNIAGKPLKSRSLDFNDDRELYNNVLDSTLQILEGNLMHFKLINS